MPNCGPINRDGQPLIKEQVKSIDDTERCVTKYTPVSPAHLVDQAGQRCGYCRLRNARDWRRLFEGNI
jgi:hypothetical protein